MHKYSANETSSQSEALIVTFLAAMSRLLHYDVILTRYDV